MGDDSEDWSWFGGGGAPTRPTGESGATRGDSPRFPSRESEAATPTTLSFGQASGAVPSDPRRFTGVSFGPSIAYLVAAAVAAVLGLLAVLFGRDNVVVNVAGWVCGGLVAIGLVTAYSYLDTRAQADTWYVRDPSRGLARIVVLVLAVVAVVANSWYFAYWAATR